jgi:hypothetical protein
MSEILKYTLNYIPLSEHYKFNIIDVSKILNDINKYIHIYKKINNYLIIGIKLNLESIYEYFMFFKDATTNDEEYINKYTGILLLLDTFNDLNKDYIDAINEYFKKTNDSKNYLNNDDINTLNNPNITIQELTKLLNSANNDYKKYEINKKIKEIKLKNKIIKKINDDLAISNDNESIYQKQNINDIINNKDNLDVKINLDLETFKNFSILNYGMYPKLISLMLHPKYFCDLWYGNTTITKDDSPYILINKILNALFILSYTHFKKNNNSFTYNRKTTFARDTIICKSLQIQNLKSFIDKLDAELSVSNMGMEDIIEYKIKLNIINIKINEIINNKNQYIFNYKLLNELQNYYSLNEIKLEKYKTEQHNTINYESVYEFYYYNDQILKSLKNINELNELFNNGCKTSFGTTCDKKNYKKLINDKYIDLMSSHAQVLTYVKERNDAHKYDLTGEMNPRYKIQLINNNTDVYENSNITSTDNNSIIKYYDLNISYFNEPKSIGMNNPKEQYFDSTKWKKNSNGKYDKYPSDINYQHRRAVEAVNIENDPRWEHYKLGKINRYYGCDVTSEKISNDPECGLILLEKLRRFEDIIIVGNGQSGAGKTAALIGYTNNNVPLPGLLPNLANKLIKPVGSDDSDKIQYFTEATVKFINLYINNDDDLNDIDKMKLQYYNPYYIKLLKKDDDGNILKDVNGNTTNVDDDIFKFTVSTNNWTCTNKSRPNHTLDQIISEAFEIREVEPTKNNPNSSRSHIIVCVTFSGTTEVNHSPEKKEAKIVICDFAGVEDKFTCELLELKLLDKNYYEKSDKYKIINNEGKPIIESERNKKQMKYINYDNYFCSNKYNNLFPKEDIHKKKNMIDENNKYIDIHDKLSTITNTDPVINSVNDYINNFKKTPIDSILNDHIKTNFTNIIKHIFDDYNFDSTKIKINTTDINNNDFVDTIITIINSLTSVNKECDNKDECCDIIQNQDIKEIEKFMKDFRMLDEKFYTTYPNMSVKQIQQQIKEEISELINLSYNLSDFQLNNFIYNIKQENIKIIKELKSIYETKKQEIETNNELEKSDNGKNYRSSLEYIQQYKNDEMANLDTKLAEDIIKINEKYNTYNIKQNISNSKSLKANKEIKKVSLNNEKKNNDIYIGYIKEMNDNKNVEFKPSSDDLYTKIFNNYSYGLTGNISNKFKLRNNSNDKKNKKIVASDNSKPVFTNVISYLTEQINNNNIFNEQKEKEIEELKIEQLNTEIQTLNESLIKMNIQIEDDIIKVKTEYDKAKQKIDDLTNTEIKITYDEKSDIIMNSMLTEIKSKFNNDMNIYINTIILNDYYNEIIEYKKTYITTDIKNFFNKRKDDYTKIKLLIQQLIRLSQLEFNCSIRRKEGYMINTSLKEMQKFIGSILFDSAKNRFNKLLIENSLMVMEQEYYRHNDYIKYNSQISSSLNLIKNVMNDIILNLNIYKSIKLKNLKNTIIENVKKVKKEVLKYFTYILSTLNNNSFSYTSNIHLDRLLIYICFIDAINLIIINDNINFDIIFNLLSNMGDANFKNKFTEFMNLIKNSKKTKINNEDLYFGNIIEIFYNNDINDINILQLVYNYSIETSKTSKLNNIINIINTKIIKSKESTNISELDPETDLKNITEVSDITTIFNIYNNEFKKFVDLYTQICDILYKDTQKQLEISKQSIKKKIDDSSKSHITPLLYSSPSTKDCIKNKYKYVDEYEKFYYKDKDKPKDNLEMLFNIMKTPGTENIIGKEGDDIHNFNIKGFGLNIDTSTLVIFTVINVTPNPTEPTNNPPIPPFININKLKLIYKIVQIPLIDTKQFITIGNNNLNKTIYKICTTYLKKINKYDFYIPYNDSFKEILNVESIIKNKGKDLKEKIIDLIDSNNATTLIGTVDFEKFTKIRDPSEPYFICDEKNDSVLKLVDNIKEIIEILNTDESEETANAEKKDVAETKALVKGAVKNRKKSTEINYVHEYDNNIENLYQIISKKVNYKNPTLDEKKERCKQYVNKKLFELSTDKKNEALKLCDTKIT